MKKDYYVAWQKDDHKEHFDGWVNLKDRGLKKLLEGYNDIQMLKEYIPHIKGKSFLEVGCATGETSRYIARTFPEFEYVGLDISLPALKHAQGKYPGRRFLSIESSAKLSEFALQNKLESSVLFARDVVIHQTKPFDYMKDLLSLPFEMCIMRLRTKDFGQTELDVEKSCQFHYGTWVPYMVLNMEEMLEVLKQAPNVSGVFIRKHYEVLGGCVRRYVPKDCYLDKTGTASTSICVIKKDTIQKVSPKVVVEEKGEHIPRLRITDRKMASLVAGARRKFERR